MHEKFMHVAPTADFSSIVIVRIIVSDATIKSLDLPVKRKRQFVMPDIVFGYLFIITI